MTEKSYVAVDVELSESQKIKIQTDANDGYADVSMSSATIDEALKQVSAFASALKPALNTATPSKVSVEFGVEFSLEAGHLTAMIAKGSATANLKVSLEWSDSKKD